MNINQLRYVTKEMWGENPQLKNTEIEGIYDTSTAGHGGYLVDSNIHPELGKYGDKTSVPNIKAFEEDYEALKVLWAYPKLISKEQRQNATKWLNREMVVKYDSKELAEQFLKDFPDNKLIDLIKQDNLSKEELNIRFLGKEILGGYNDITTYNLHLNINGEDKNILAEKECFDYLEGSNIWSIVEEKTNLTEMVKRDIISNYLDEPVYRKYNNNNKEIMVNYSDVNNIFGKDIIILNKETIIPLAKNLVKSYLDKDEDIEFTEFIKNYQKDENDLKLVEKLNKETECNDYKTFKKVLGLIQDEENEEDEL